MARSVGRLDSPRSLHRVCLRRIVDRQSVNRARRVGETSIAMGAWSIVLAVFLLIWFIAAGWAVLVTA